MFQLLLLCLSFLLFTSLTIALPRKDLVVDVDMNGRFVVNSAVTVNFNVQGSVSLANLLANQLVVVPEKECKITLKDANLVNIKRESALGRGLSGFIDRFVRYKVTQILPQKNLDMLQKPMDTCFTVTSATMSDKSVELNLKITAYPSVPLLPSLIEDKDEHEMMDPQDPILRSLRTKRGQIFLALGLFSLVLVAIMVVYRDAILEKLEALATFIKDQGFLGALLLMSLIIVTSFPPLVGYGTLVTISGFVYKFPLGFVPAGIAAFTGACLCFHIGRTYFKDKAKIWLHSNYPKLQKAVERVVDNGGLKLLILIRLAPYPFSVVSLVLSTTDVSFSQYAIATAVSLVKLISHIAVGASLQSLATKTPPSAFEIIVLVLSIGLGIAVFVYVMRFIKAQMAEMELDEELEAGILDFDQDKPQSAVVFDVAEALGEEDDENWDTWDDPK